MLVFILVDFGQLWHQQTKCLYLIGPILMNKLHIQCKKTSFTKSNEQMVKMLNFDLNIRKPGIWMNIRAKCPFHKTS